MQAAPSPLPGYIAQVFRTDDLWVVSGANHGDPLGGPDDVALGDVYQIDPAAAPLRLILGPRSSERGADLRVAAGSDIGQAGDAVEVVAQFTFLAAHGDRIDALCLRHANAGDFLLPLSPLAPRADYTLIDCRAAAGDIRLGATICVAFGGGTLITVAGGRQRPIEALKPGDLILTRDHGDQPIRWIGQATMRAQGAFAPVVIAAGTLGNGADLIVSPHHRLFIYQRGLRRLGGTAEILVQAKHLIEDEFVRRREGGFIDYFSLVFDRHEIVYAEGIPAESLMVTEATVAMLPDSLGEEIRRGFPTLSQPQAYGTEVGRRAIEEFGREAFFRFPKKA